MAGYKRDLVIDANSPPLSPLSSLPSWATITNAIAAIVIVPTFAITITAATVEVTAFVVIIATTAVVAHVQHIVHAKPPNEQTKFSAAP
jgi:hypothetical protein